MKSQSGSKGDAKRKYWRQQIQNWKESGLSQKQFCLSRSIAFSTFCYWKSRLKSLEPAQPNFYPLALPAPSSPESSDTGLKLIVGKKQFQVEIKKDFCKSTLRQLIATLEQL